MAHSGLRAPIRHVPSAGQLLLVEYSALPKRRPELPVATALPQSHVLLALVPAEAQELPMCPYRAPEVGKRRAPLADHSRQSTKQGSPETGGQRTRAGRRKQSHMARMDPRGSAAAWGAVAPGPGR